MSALNVLPIFPCDSSRTTLLQKIAALAHAIATGATPEDMSDIIQLEAPYITDTQEVVLLRKIGAALYDFALNGGAGAIPDQSGHAGEVLSTDGSDLEWVAQGGAATLQIEAATLAGLKAIGTTTKSAGHVVLAKFSGESAAIMVLTAGTNNDDNAGDHRPDDYNAVTNIKYWHRSS